MKNNSGNKFFLKFFTPVFKKHWYVYFLIFILVFAPFLEGYFYKQIIDSISLNNVQLQDIIYMILIWGGVLIISLFALAIYRVMVSRLSIDVEQEYVKSIYQQYWSLPMEFHQAQSTGEFFTKLQNGQQAIWNIYSTLFLHIIPSWFGLTVMFVFSAFINWQMTLLLFLLVPAQYFILNSGIKRNNQEVRKMNQEYNKFYKFAHDSTANIMMVKSYFQDQDIFNITLRNFFNYANLHKKISTRWGKINVLSLLISVFSRLIIFIFGAYLIINNQLTLGTFIMFFTFSSLIFQPIQLLGEQLSKLQLNFANLKIVQEIFADTEIETDEKPPLELNELELQFKNVSFSYKDNHKILTNISFKSKKNTITALVGHSGTGKSTITNLINKFYSPTSGQIILSGKDIANFSSQSVRNYIGVVFQENMMLNDTILNNITLFQNVSEETLQKVISLADLNDFVRHLPNGLETIIGERGLKISGGEKQRLAIARVLLKNPSILIFDEATSNLDSISEHKIQNVIKNISKDRITIIVTHRLSTIQNAEQIIVLNQGQIDNIGTHKTLIASSKVYQELIENMTKL